MNEIQVKKKPIIFSTPMVRAILDGKKTQTRRVVKPQPRPTLKGWVVGCREEIGKEDHFTFDDDVCDWIFQEQYGGEVYGPRYAPPGGVYGNGQADRLWVREAWQHSGWRGDELVKPAYRASGDEACGWRPSIFMPRALSRILLEVTDIRVERVADISTQDVIAEGILPDMETHAGEYWREDAVHQFRELWDSINEKRGFSWDANPFVWVIEFRRLNNE